MRAARRVVVTGVLAATTAALWPAAAAQAEETPAVARAAWFSASAASQPAADGDLRVARALETQALSTLLYRGEGARAALDLTLRDGAGAGTPDIVACPTVGADWADGGNQPIEAAPAVDCERSLQYGVLSEDGGSLSFGLDAAFEVSPGTWSIALVPAPGAVSPGPPPKTPLPFTTDLQRPEVGAFVLEEEFVLPTQPAPDTAPVADGGGSGSGSGAALAGGFAALPVEAGTAATGPLDPTVAPPAPPAAPPVPLPVTLAQPVAIRQAAQADDDAGRRLLALLALAGGSAAVGYAAGQQRPGPRLLGGRAGLAGAVPAVVTAAGDERPRGIGRFARERDAAPRRLR